MATRQFGWIPEVEEPQLHLKKLAPTVQLPSSVLLVSKPMLAVFDQGYTSTCVAQAICQGMRALMIRQGLLDPPTPSRRWVYKLACESHGMGNVDEGTYISAPPRIMRDVGWCTEKYAPWNDAKAYLVDRAERDAWVMAGMGISAHHHAVDQKDALQEYGCGGSKQAMMETLSSGYPFVAGATVTTPFMDLGAAWVPVELTGPAEGGHAMLFLGYEERGLVGINSWGTLWGNAGWFLLGWDSAVSELRNHRALQQIERPTS